MLWPRITPEQSARIAPNHVSEALDSGVTFCVVSVKSLLRPL